MSWFSFFKRVWPRSDELNRPSRPGADVCAVLDVASDH